MSTQAGQLRLVQRSAAPYGVTDVEPVLMVSSSTAVGELADSTNAVLAHQSITSSGGVLRVWLRYRVDTPIPGGRRMAVRLVGLPNKSEIVALGRHGGYVYINNTTGSSHSAFPIIITTQGGEFLALFGTSSLTTSVPSMATNDTIDVRMELLLPKEI